MSIAFQDLTSDHFAQAIKNGIQLELEAAIVKELSNVVMPKIKELAKKAARDVCAQGQAKLALDNSTMTLKAFVSFDSGMTVEEA